ncbi:MAG TPA: NAD(P)H-dependent glycerol-3-phosphate dehydrogenase [Roseimicrobium sp.]|nr:NAD(P)H-dependent glycerol-3-phosphate dehydrogenase [Roseimicrobium sp.]
MMNVTVLGAGAWGTALASLLAKNGHHTTLWGHNPQHLDQVSKTRKNDRYLPGIELPAECRIEADIHLAAQDADCLVMAVPSKAFRTVSSHLRKFDGIAVSVTKGIEFDSGLTMCGIMQQTMPSAKLAALSGPTLAAEVARGIPTAIVAASSKDSTAAAVQKLFHRPSFRVYTSTDLLGVELGGALKNVIAIAAGVGDGLGFGDNSKAGLITRAILEIQRLGVACGARAETFSGLSGLGDLTVTCFSKLSRNRGFGERIGRGEQIANILLTSTNVAEGYPTACSAYQLAKKLKVETPIIDQVHAMLYQGKNVKQAVADLTSRDLKSEY